MPAQLINQLLRQQEQPSRFFGTNPISFAWPRPGHAPVVYDMATATLAKGDVQIAARDGHDVPLGTGLGPDGQPTTDPAEILKGVMLPLWRL